MQCFAIQQKQNKMKRLHCWIQQHDHVSHQLIILIHSNLVIAKMVFKILKWFGEGFMNPGINISVLCTGITDKHSLQHGICIKNKCLQKVKKIYVLLTCDCVNKTKNFEKN